jgi:hypothetical protein
VTLLRRVRAGLVSDKQSIATGLLIALILWTVTRLADGITGSGTIEYETVVTPATLATGGSANEIAVTLTNLSADTSITRLRVSISDPQFKTTFSSDLRDRSCAFEPPAWAAGAICDPHNVGMTFEAPMLVPGTSVRLSIKYTQSPDSAHRPVVRIRPESASSFQLVEPGLRTFIARHEEVLLLLILGGALLIFVVSVATGVGKPPAPPGGGQSCAG